MKTLYRFLPALCCLLLTRKALAQTAYTIQDLGNFGGAIPQVTGLNNNGEIVATFDNNSLHTVGYYSKGGWRDITVSAPTPGTINDAGQIATTTVRYGFSLVGQAALYNAHTGQTQLLGPANSMGIAFAVNQNGNASGLVAVQNTPYQQAYPALFKNGQVTQLNKAVDTALTSGAEAINNHDQVVGQVVDSTGAIQHAVLYSGGSVYDLGTLPGGNNSVATGINDSGVIVGYSTGTGIPEYHPFLYQNGKMQDLGTFGGPSGEATGINNAGVVVGDAESYTATGRIVRNPFVYSNGVMSKLFDLAPDGSSWLDGYEPVINDKGQIAGTAYHNGRLTVFLATPIAVPEPGPLLTFGLGTGVMLLAARRKPRAVRR